MVCWQLASGKIYLDLPQYLIAGQGTHYQPLASALVANCYQVAGFLRILLIICSPAYPSLHTPAPNCVFFLFPFSGFRSPRRWFLAPCFILVPALNH